jgi:hypothetical protein
MSTGSSWANANWLVAKTATAVKRIRAMDFILGISRLVEK